MRTQVMMHGGPYDGTLTGMTAVEVPTEIRLADLAGEQTDEKVDAHLYRLEGHDETMGIASYSYVAPVVSRVGLVNVWIA